MATTPDSIHSQTLVCNTDIRQQIHAAFDHIALSLSCTLQALLEETRSRGIRDSDVRMILTIDEIEATHGLASNMQLLCYRSNAGVDYITRDTAAENEPVSTSEAFGRVSPQNGPVGRVSHLHRDA